MKFAKLSYNELKKIASEYKIINVERAFVAAVKRKSQFKASELERAFKCSFLVVRKLHHRFNRLTNEAKTTLNTPEKRKNRIAQSLMVNGKPLNLVERYIIASKSLGLDRALNDINRSATEKHKLLAVLLGCGEQTARELYNGTQQKRTSARDDMIEGFFNNE